jgi:transketolase
MRDIGFLEKKARQIRRHIVYQVGEAGSGHPGGALSAVEIFTSLYFEVMRINPKEPKWTGRDYFILSKGHASAVYYAALAERGYFPVAELANYKKPWGKLPGHPDMNKVIGADMTTGSLGQGLSVAVGLAISVKYDQKDNRVYVVMGDGEIQEGQVWEAAMAAAHYKLDNITAFIDRNGLQIDGDTEKIMGVEPLREKWQSFGWNVLEIDGHNFIEILDAIDKAKQTKGKPAVIIAKTVKGKGVSYMEGKAEWHGKAPAGELYQQAMLELEGK